MGRIAIHGSIVRAVNMIAHIVALLNPPPRIIEQPIRTMKKIGKDTTIARNKPY
jgi:hypothetical protein